MDGMESKLVVRLLELRSATQMSWSKSGSAAMAPAAAVMRRRVLRRREVSVPSAMGKGGGEGEEGRMLLIKVDFFGVQEGGGEKPGL